MDRFRGRHIQGRRAHRARVRPVTRVFLAAVALAGLLLPGCATTPPASSGRIRIVAAENFWGSIASQLGGDRASVRAIIVNPAQDPHAYEPNAADARTLAAAQLAIVNGLGYDLWASRLLSANPTPQRVTLNVGELLSFREGENPHLWYSPLDVERVAAAITAALKRLDPARAAYFDRQRTDFEQRRLAQYRALIAQIKARYAGTPVGVSESIFALMAPTLGLHLLTPPSFMKAIAEGTDVSAADTASTQHQITAHQIKVWIYNSQNATPQIAQLNTLARAAHIPIVTITETLSPPTASFEQWQVSQLRRLAGALRAATGR